MRIPTNLDELRRVWIEALDDNSPGVSPEQVFSRLEQKYRALAEAAERKGISGSIPH